MTQPLSADEIRDMLINPYYAIVIDETQFGDEGIKGDQAVWVKKSRASIEKVGAKQWLSHVLEVLSDPSTVKIYKDVITPFKMTFFSMKLRGDHPLLVSKEQWIAANIKLIDELGVEEWVWRFLEVLHGDEEDEPDLID